MDKVMDDDFDPLAPMYVDTAVADDVDDASRGGFADPASIVRIWFTDGELSRVRVSLAWRERLGHRDLDSAVNAAFALARLQIPAPGAEEPGEDLSGIDFSSVTRFGGDVFTTFRLAFESFQRRWQEALDRLEREPPVPVVPVRGEYEGVVVTLDEHGQPESAVFDEEWLEDAEHREIAEHLLEATARARAAYQPAPDRAGELIRLAREHEILMAGLVASLSGKGPR